MRFRTPRADEAVDRRTVGAGHGAQHLTGPLDHEPGRVEVVHDVHRGVEDVRIPGAARPVDEVARVVRDDDERPARGQRPRGVVQRVAAGRRGQLQVGDDHQLDR